MGIMGSDAGHLNRNLPCLKGPQSPEGVVLPSSQLCIITKSGQKANSQAESRASVFKEREKESRAHWSLRKDTVEMEGRIRA